MSVPTTFDYAVLRLVPRVERGEFINAGVILFCLQQQCLLVHISLDPARALALWPTLDIAEVQRHLQAIDRICHGDPAAGAIARMSKRERFHWLVAPRSTVIQVSPVHSGLSADPQAALQRLIQQFLPV